MSITYSIIEGIKTIPFNTLIVESDDGYYTLNTNHKLEKISEDSYYENDSKIEFRLIITSILSGGYNILIGWPNREELSQEETMKFNQFYNNICSNIRKLNYIINMNTNVMFKPCMKQIFFR